MMLQLETTRQLPPDWLEKDCGVPVARFPVTLCTLPAQVCIRVFLFNFQRKCFALEYSILLHLLRIARVAKSGGLDVHKDKIVACILTGSLGKPTHSEIREFATLIPDMIALRNGRISRNCHYVAMESTGVYWLPIYEVLEDSFSGDITLLVVNARHMKNVSDKKTDMRDFPNGFPPCCVPDF